VRRIRNQLGVIDIQTKGFANSKAGAREKADERDERPATERVDESKLVRRLHEPTDLLV